MKKEGFTLIELLAVLIVLAAISAILIPMVSDMLEESEQKAYDQQIKEIEKAAKNWVLDNEKLLIEVDENVNISYKNCFVYLSDLKNLGYFENDTTINPVNDENIEDTVIELEYDYNIKQYLYSVIDNGDTNYYPCIEE